MRKLVKVVLPLTLSTLIILGLIFPAQGQLMPRITIEPQTVTVTVCSEFTVDIWIRDFSPLLLVGFDMYITWDPKMMELVGFDEYGSDRGWYNFGDGDDGWLGYGATAWSFQPPPGGLIAPAWTKNDTWVTLTFHCLAAGTSSIRVESWEAESIDLWDGESPSPFPVSPEPFEATVHQFKAVGGVLTPTNKLEVLAPYLTLLGLLGAVAVAVTTKRRHKP